MATISTAMLHARADQAAAAGDFYAALAASAAALAAAPLDHRARLKVGLCLAMLGKTPEAVATLRVVAESLAHRGFVLSAIGACRDALGLAPGAPAIVETLKTLHARIHRAEGGAKARVPPPAPPARVDDDDLRGWQNREPGPLVDAAFELATTSPVEGGAQAVGHVPFFSELSPEAFVSVVARMGYLKVPASHPVIREGHAGTSVYILLEGEVQVTRTTDDTTAELARLGGGALFGELALLTEKPRRATVQTTAPSELFEIDKAMLETVAAEHPQVAQQIGAFARRRLLTNVMAASPVFSPLEPQQRVELLRQFESLVVDVGATLITDGQQAEGLFVVVEGEVEVSKLDEGGDRVVLAYLREGDVFGEIGLVENQSATADVRAAEKSVVLCLDRDRFGAFAEAHPEIVAVLEDLSGARREETKGAMADGDALEADDLIIL